MEADDLGLPTDMDHQIGGSQTDSGFEHPPDQDENMDDFSAVDGDSDVADKQGGKQDDDFFYIN